MIFTTEMVQLFGVALGRDSQRLTEALLREGCMQFVQTSEYEGKFSGALSPDQAQVQTAVISELRKRIEGFLHTGGVIPSVPENIDVNNRVKVDIDKESNLLNQISAQRDGLRDKQRSIHQEILKFEDIKRQLELYGTDIPDLRLATRSSLISMQVGKLPVSNVSQLESDLKDFLSFSSPMAVEGNIAHRFLIFMKRDKAEIDKVLSKAGWSEVELPSERHPVDKNIFEEITSKIQKLNIEQKELETKAKDIVKNEVGRLQKTWVNLWVNELYYRIQTNFEPSSRTIVFTGWLPASKRVRLTKRIMEACQGRCHLEWSEATAADATGDEIPVQMKNPKFLEPFQMLVSNFGIPKYGTIDPTAFVMPLYLSMFGLMFADIGQGLILVVLGFLAAYFFKNNEQKRGMYNLSWLLAWCGFSSVLFGAFFGSFFGMNDIVKPLWFDFHGIVAGHSSQSSMVKDVYGVLSITLYFGIMVITLGLLFNWVNLIRTRQWDDLIFDKGGILGGWIYAGGTYIAFYYVSHGYKLFPEAMLMFILVGIPSILFSIKEPYHFFKHKKADEKFGPATMMNFVMYWVVELLEIFSGYLSNTLSFMRVAGLGIAHVCLMISFFTLADMTSGIASVAILVFGNVLVIGLEGLSAGIQALRLNYYEFFTKFFHGTGKLYTPISLNSKIK